MINLNSRESMLLKSIKLHKAYKFKHPQFEEFYSKFKGEYLYKEKPLLMAFFALYGDKYNYLQVEHLLMKDCFSLLFKIKNELPPKFIQHQLDYVLGELRIIPIGTIENEMYIKKIDFHDFFHKKVATEFFKNIFFIKKNKISFRSASNGYSIKIQLRK